MERLFNRNETVLARWKSGDGMLAGLLARNARLARAAEWMVLRVSWSDSAAERGMHALEILAHEGSINRITPHHHTVLSLSNPSRRYNVTQRRCNWSCDCPDHLHRKAHCKHILAVTYHVVEREEAALGMPDTRADPGAGTRQDGQPEQPDVHIEEVPEYPEKCMACPETRIIKWGFTGKGKSRRQRYKCQNPECGCTFVYRGGFERMRKPVWAILRAFNDFFKGHTPKDIADTLGKGIQVPELEQLLGHAAQDVADAIGELKCEVNGSSIYRWLAKFIPPAHEHLRQIPIRTGEHLAADEVCLSGKDDEDGNDAKKSAAAGAQPEGSKRKKWYLFSTTDILTRFCPAFDMADHKDGFNATNLLKETLRRTGKVPSVLTTDCLPSYSEAHQAVFAAKNPLDKHSVHISDSCLNNKKKHNNFQERFNGTYRKFQRPRQNIPNPHSPLITGFFVYYNFVRPHSSLNGRTPAEAAGVIIHGDDKWRTIIGNAGLAARAGEAGP